MKVRELIEKLQQCDPDLPVCIADWSELYSHPSESDAERVNQVEGSFYPREVPPDNLTAYISGKFVCIG